MMNRVPNNGGFRTLANDGAPKAPGGRYQGGGPHPAPPHQLNQLTHHVTLVKSDLFKGMNMPASSEVVITASVQASCGYADTTL